MHYCGIWHTKRRLYACTIDEYGAYTGRHTSFDTEPEDFWDLLTYVEDQHGLDIGFVLTNELLCSHGAFAAILRQRGCDVFVAAASLVRQLRVLAMPCNRAPPHHLALLLARLPLCSCAYHRLSPLWPYLEHDIP